MTVPAAVYFIATLVAAGQVVAQEWRYQDEAHWTPLCHEGKLQSPIALSESIATQKEFTRFIMQGYDDKVVAFLKNNGHSAEVRPHIIQNRPEIKGGGLPQIYQLDHLHFHWQSEHTIDDKRFPLELHLVHYAKDYGNLSAALQHQQGIAVFAVLFELSPDDDAEFEPLLHIIESLKDKVNEQKQLPDVIVRNYLPRNVAGFYRYEGSLTTPGCNEGVVWTVFTNTIPISSGQVKIFQEIHTTDNTALTQNYRSLQALNDRPVFLKISPIRNGAKATEISIPLSVVLALFAHYIIRN